MFVEKLAIGMTMTMLFTAFMLPNLVVISGITNPFNDLTASVSLSSPGAGPGQSATTQGNNPDNISPAQAQNLGCGGSVLTGVVAGAIVGSFVPVVGTLIGAGVGGLIGGVTGCAVLPRVAPNAIQGFGNAIQGAANSAGIGGITSLLGQIVGVLNGLVKFIPDFIVYQQALYSVDSVAGAFMTVTESATIFIWALYFIRVTRGSEG
jgi:hypothetical protein